MTTGAESDVGQANVEAEEAKARSIERASRAEHRRKRARHTLERVGGALERPVVGASVAGGLVAAAAGMWGPSEAVLGAVVGLLAYRMLKRRRREHVPAPEASPAQGFAG